MQPGEDQAPDRDEEIRAWLRWAMKLTGLKTTPFAKEAGVAPSTLLRALDPDNPVSTERRTIDKIIERFKLPGPDTYLAHGSYSNATTIARGFSDVEIEQYNAEEGKLAPTQGAWTIRTRALELAGYLPGDRIIVDSAVTPRSGDIVVAQQLHTGRPGAQTVIRQYDAPYLLTATLDESARRKPLPVDGSDVSIWGVVIRAQRHLR